MALTQTHAARLCTFLRGPVAAAGGGIPGPLPLLHPERIPALTAEGPVPGRGQGGVGHQ